MGTSFPVVKGAANSEATSLLAEALLPASYTLLAFSVNNIVNIWHSHPPTRRNLEGSRLVMAGWVKKEKMGIIDRGENRCYKYKYLILLSNKGWGCGFRRSVNKCGAAIPEE